MKYKMAGCLVAGISLWLANNCDAAGFEENFSGDPLTNGWAVYGSTNLFRWNASNGQLEVTWDSSKTNSYFFRPLAAPLTKADEFKVEFDLRLDEVVQGSFQLAIGLLNWSDATKPGFLRGTGSDSPNLVEFDYFAAWNSLNATVSDSKGAMQFVYDDTHSLVPETTYRVVLSHASGDAFVKGAIYDGATVYSALPLAYTNSAFTDFQVDTLAVASYSDYLGWGSVVYAVGVVDNFVVQVPEAAGQVPSLITGGFVEQAFQVRLDGQPDYVYRLRRAVSVESETWDDVDSVDGALAEITLSDTNPPTARAFYRVLAQPR